MASTASKAFGPLLFLLMSLLVLMVVFVTLHHISSNVSDIAEELGAVEAGVSRVLEDVQRANLAMQDVLENLDEVKSTLSQVTEQGQKHVSCLEEEVRDCLGAEAASDKLFIQELSQEMQTLSR